jgi:hypothetical protein
MGHANRKCAEAGKTFRCHMAKSPTVNQTFVCDQAKLPMAIQTFVCDQAKSPMAIQTFVCHQAKLPMAIQTFFCHQAKLLMAIQTFVCHQAKLPMTIQTFVCHIRKPGMAFWTFLSSPCKRDDHPPAPLRSNVEAGFHGIGPSAPCQICRNKRKFHGNEPPQAKPLRARPKLALSDYWLGGVACMALIRPLPRGPWWAFALALVVFLGGFFAAGILSSPWPLVFSVLAIIGFCSLRGVRCPQCGRRLTERRVPVDDGPAQRIFWECSGCAAVWDGQSVFDPRGP